MDDTTDRLDLDAIREYLTRAGSTLIRLCNGQERWRMSIPARPDSDPDLILAQALKDADVLLAEVARLRAERDTLAAALATVEGALAAYWENNPPGTPGYNPAVAAVLDLLTSRVVLAEHAEETN